MEQPFFYNLRIPLATYRLQFNGNFRFADAADIIPYLRELGISDVYASPYLKACPGSSHGYDITDPTKINPEIGTEEEYGLFIDALQRHSMGQILDIVPNHMCIVGSNRYWLDVLENGQASRYAKYFDIDWHPVKKELHNKILLPILGDQYGNALENRDVQLEFHEGAFYVRVYEHRLPLLPETYGEILLWNTEGDAVNSMCRKLLIVADWAQNLPPHFEDNTDLAEGRYRMIDTIKRTLKHLSLNDADVRALIENNVRVFNGHEGDPKSFDLLDNLLSQQIYRLSDWRVAAEEINYRRFFDINSLAAIRVEDFDVFEETHRLIFKLIAEKKVTGLRVDHPDGLHDPSEYFNRLQRSCFSIALRSRFEEVRQDVDLPYGNNYIESTISRRYDAALDAPKHFKPFYIVAEKILGKSETMPAEWPLFSTTGYVFLNSLNGIFIDTRNAKAFDALYKRFIKTRFDFQEILYQKKKLVMQAAMSSEINTLAHRLNMITERNRHTRDFTLNSLAEAIIEVIACFPVYRTYIKGQDVKDRDRHYVELAVSRALRKNPVLNDSIFRFIKDILLLSSYAGKDDAEKEAWLAFTMKLQQITGPVMAKGVEDTAFYIYNRLVSLNEVGGNPERFGTSLETFHGQNIERVKSWPYALIASSTHDTKRGEDVRARINVLSELPGEWGERVSLWARLNKRKKINLNKRAVPDRNEEYLLYQTLLGTWPRAPMTNEEYAVYRSRIKCYMIKAVKEAKVNTSWTNPDSLYEEAFAVFIDTILDREQDNPFLDDFTVFQEKIAKCGMHNSCAQTLLKICSPGIPDFYQGSEFWDLSLVDPDNRAPVDYRKRIAVLREMKEDIARKGMIEYAQEITTSMSDARIKMYIIYRALAFRREARQLFEEGEYVPLETSGIFADHIIAFARRLHNKSLIVAVPRFLAKVFFLSGPDIGKAWGDTMLVVPDSVDDHTYEDLFTGEKLDRFPSGPPGLMCSALFRYFPVALLKTGF